MKKYIIPALSVADINNETILAGSLGDGTLGNTVPGGGKDNNFANQRDNLFDWTDDNEE